ncbi:MAG TPA: hypothetical protein PLI62_14230 [Spirochaetota bacterium]|nr:hypothetical protein [Spirochaetota bacterium]HQO03419.1 hypothetical protein [Spirochaetota bacterium]
MTTITDPSKIKLFKTLYDLNGATWNKFNLSGISNSADAENDVWNDVLIAASDEVILLCQGTTDPGRAATLQHSVGADHLQIGFYKDLWEIGWHGGKDKSWRHRAFVQGMRQVSTVRDTNRNFIVDPEDLLITDKAGWGMNGHTVIGPRPATIGNWSWGCQVWLFRNEFEKVLSLAEKSGMKLFSYLLMPLKSENKEFYFLNAAA